MKYPLVLLLTWASLTLGQGADRKRETKGKSQTETTAASDAAVLKKLGSSPPKVPAALPAKVAVPQTPPASSGEAATKELVRKAGAAQLPSVSGTVSPSSREQLSEVPNLPLAPSQTRSVSSSKQFLIDGGDLNLRGALSYFLEEVRASFTTLLTDREQWKIPVIVRVAPNERGLPSALASEVSQFENGSYHLQINLRMGPDFSQELLAREVLQMLMAERGLRKALSVTAPQGRILPPWLVEGVSEAIAYKKRGGPDAVFASLFRNNNLPSVSDLLSAEKAGDDVLSRATFHAACGALVLALLDQPDGPARFTQMLGDMAVAPDQGERLLRRHFPGFNGSTNRLSKWWALQLAQISQKTDVFAMMTPAETEAKLQSILVFRMVVGTDGKAPREKGPNVLARWFKRGKKLVGLDKEKERDKEPAQSSGEKAKAVAKDKEKDEPDQRLVTVPLEEFARLKGRNDSRTLLVSLDERLNEVLVRGFPLHRPIALAYHEVVMLLLKGEDKNVPAILERLARERKSLLAQMKSVESYLDWHLATQTKTKSGAFDDYFQAVNEVTTSPVRRKDGISDYLDELEKEWEPVTSSNP